jgi:hypothetical protein
MFDSILLPPYVGRTKAEPPIYYMPTKPIIDDPAIVEQNKEKVYPSIFFLEKRRRTAPQIYIRRKEKV